MRLQLLGQSGLRVSELVLGTMTFGEDWGWGASKEESRRIFETFVEAGGNFIDTACNYTEGTAERFVGEFVKADRDEFVIATKYSLRPNGANRKDPNRGGNHRKNMLREVEASLKRLDTDYIDLLYLHMWDFTTPETEVLRAVDDLVRQGKVHYFALSDTPAWVVSRMVTLAEQHGWTRPVAIQIPYHLASRDPERELLPMAHALDLAVCPWGLLGGGTLTGKYREPAATKRYEGASEQRLTAGDLVVQIAGELGHSPAQVAINWVRAQRHLAQMLPILGVRSEAQFRDNLGCLEWDLSAKQIERLGKASEFNRGFPLDFLTDDHVRGLLFGETFTRIDNHRGFPN